MSRERIDLCGLWRFQPDPGWEGEARAYAHPEYDHRRWREVRLPASFDDCAPGLEAYEGAGWFRRSLTVPAEWADRRLVLHFEGANVHTAVWVNGRKAGEHPYGFLPFEFPVEHLVRPGAENLIAVRVDNVRRQGEVPGMQRGWRTYGGILRQVELVATDPLHLDHLALVAELAGGGGTLTLRAVVRNERPETVEAALTVQVTGEGGETLAQLASSPTSLGAGEGTTFALEGQVPDAAPWSPDEPALYTASVELTEGGQAVDGQEVRFGFRTVKARDGRLLLNGQPLFLTGFNRHEDSPRTGMATDLALVRRDLIDIKEAGANFVRLCHYPHHPGEIDLCDELGLLVMDEIPLYWWDGCAEGEENHLAKLQAAGRQLRALIRRDINHPSVIFWSVSNENDERRPEVVEGNRELIRLARELDPTRLAVHVSNHWQRDPAATGRMLRDPHFDEDDVLCVNAYPSLDSRALGGQHAYDLADSTRFWREGLRALHERYPDKPVLVSEYGYASFQGVYDSAFGEDVQAQAIESEFAGMDAPYVCGATIWCWADHAWPAGTFAYCRHLGISPYGILSRDRRQLRAYAAVRRIYRQRQGRVQGEGRRGPQAGGAGVSVDMIRPHLLDIPQIPCPEGYGIRPMRLDEAGLWTDIERDAEPYFPIADDLFWREFGSDPQAIQWRCFIVTDDRGVGVGTISAWYDRDYKGQDYGKVHWVAIRPAYQGKGLGKAALAYALNQLARWHDRAMLNTQTGRIPAIKLYLNFGFLPDLDPPGAVEAWRQVAGQIKHPTLERALRDYDPPAPVSR